MFDSVWEVRTVLKGYDMRLVPIMSAKIRKRKLQDDVNEVRGGGYRGVCCFDRMGASKGRLLGSYYCAQALWFFCDARKI